MSFIYTYPKYYHIVDQTHKYLLTTVNESFDKKFINMTFVPIQDKCKNDVDYIKSWHDHQNIEDLYSVFHKGRLALLTGKQRISFSGSLSNVKNPDIQITDLQIVEVTPTYNYELVPQEDILEAIEEIENKKRLDKKISIDSLIAKLDVNKISDEDLERIQSCLAKLK